MCLFPRLLFYIFIKNSHKKLLFSAETSSPKLTLKVFLQSYLLIGPPTVEHLLGLSID